MHFTCDTVNRSLSFEIISLLLICILIFLFSEEYENISSAFMIKTSHLFNNIVKKFTDTTVGFHLILFHIHHTIFFITRMTL